MLGPRHCPGQGSRGASAWDAQQTVQAAEGAHCLPGLEACAGGGLPCVRGHCIVLHTHILLARDAARGIANLQHRRPQWRAWRFSQHCTMHALQPRIAVDALNGTSWDGYASPAMRPSPLAMSFLFNPGGHWDFEIPKTSRYMSTVFSFLWYSLSQSARGLVI